MIIRVHWDNVVRIGNVQFHKFSGLAMPDYDVHRIVYRGILKGTEGWGDAVINTPPLGGGQVHYHMPLVRMRLGDEAQRTNLNVTT